MESTIERIFTSYIFKKKSTLNDQTQLIDAETEQSIHQPCVVTNQESKDESTLNIAIEESGSCISQEQLK